MKIFAACVGMMLETYNSVLYPRFCVPHPKFAELRSYHELMYFSGHTAPVFGKPFFFDSGAFTAYSQGVEITVKQYGEFVSKHLDQIGPIYANLDAIPKAPTKEARAEAAEQTLRNQLALEDMGLEPLPVFHAGEPWEYLERYIDEYEYICLGGLVDSGTLWDFLDDAWGNHLTDSDGRPRCKVHGFGMTSLYGMTRYPWASCDSSTWLVHSKFGIIAFPRKLGEGEWDWSFKPTLVAISDNSSYKADEGKHFDNMSKAQQDEIHEYLKISGIPLEELRGHPVNRFITNLEYWMNVEKYADFATTFHKKQFSLL